VSATQVVLSGTGDRERALGFMGLEADRVMLQRGERSEEARLSGSSWGVTGFRAELRLRSRGVVSFQQVLGLGRVFGEFLTCVARRPSGCGETCVSPGLAVTGEVISPSFGMGVLRKGGREELLKRGVCGVGSNGKEVRALRGVRLLESGSSSKAGVSHERKRHETRPWSCGSLKPLRG
jgi:hypothetical protein